MQLREGNNFPCNLSEGRKAGF